MRRGLPLGRAAPPARDSTQCRVGRWPGLRQGSDLTVATEVGDVGLAVPRDRAVMDHFLAPRASALVMD